MGNQDNAMEGLTWKRYVVIVAIFLLILGIVLLITNYSRTSVRLTSLSLIFGSLACFALVITNFILNRYFRIWPMLIGAIITLALFFTGLVFFFMSFAY